MEAFRTTGCRRGHARATPPPAHAPLPPLHHLPGRLAAAIALAITCTAGHAQSPPRPSHIEGSTRKLEQLIGDWDRQHKVRTETRTASRYRLLGTDLGYSFRAGDRIIFLFGDSLGPGHGDAIGYTGRLEGGTPLGLRFYETQGVYRKLRAPGLSTGGFEVPTGGIHLDGQTWIWFKTDRNKSEQKNRCMLLRYDLDSGQATIVREFSPLGGKFIEVHASRWSDPPAGGSPFANPVLLWGTGQTYRKSRMFLAVLDGDRMETASAVRYFTGTDGNGLPIWGDSESDAVPIGPAGRLFGEFSIFRCADRGPWFLLAQGDLPKRGVKLNAAVDPWGPWSDHAVVFRPWKDKGYGHFMHIRMKIDGLAGPLIFPREDPRQVWGGEYGPYAIEDHCSYRDGVLTMRYLLSTWNPYTVVLMESKARIEVDR